MGNWCLTSAKRTERTMNHSPDEQLQTKAKNLSGKKKGIEKQQLVRFFMTGLGSAGKSTIVRQLHLLCKRNPSYKLCDEDWNELAAEKVEANTQAEADAWAKRIRRNLLEAFDLLIKYVGQQGTGFGCKANAQFAERIEEICEEGRWHEVEKDLDTFRVGLIALFHKNSVKAALKHKNKLQIDDGRKLFDGCDYFLHEQRINEVFSHGYMASDEAKVHSRNPTDDMRTYRFRLNRTRIEITDVGGQRSELVKMVDYLRNWSFSSGECSHNFILLVVSMSDYNVRHQRYEGSTLLDECIQYMKVLLNNRVAQQCGLLIFFNKKDRFKEKLMDPECRQDIAFLAPHVTSKQTRDYLAKGKFNERQFGEALARKFVDALEQLEGRHKDTYCRFTCALDTKMMEGIFGAVKDEILNETMLNAFP